MFGAEYFALGLVVLSIGALGVSILYDVSRLSVANGRRTLVRRRMETRSAELEASRKRASDAEAEAQARQAVVDGLTAERQRIQSLIKTVEADKVELVHELGDGEMAACLFSCELKTTPEFSRLDPRKMIFCRDIWLRRNVAHIWADTIEDAQAIAVRTFHGRAGVVPGRLIRLETRKPPQNPEAKNG